MHYNINISNNECNGDQSKKKKKQFDIAFAVPSDRDQTPIGAFMKWYASVGHPQTETQTEILRSKTLFENIFIIQQYE